MAGETPDPFETFVIRFRALPDDVPAAQRVNRLLKFALRSCALKNVGFVDAPHPAGDPRPAIADRDAAGNAPDTATDNGEVRP